MREVTDLLNKIKRTAAGLFILIMLFSACRSEYDNDSSSYSLNFTPNNTAASSLINPETVSDTYDAQNTPIDKDNIIDADKEIEQYGLRFKLENVYKSKELPDGVEKNDITIYFDASADDSGRLTSKASYLFVTLNVKNTNSNSVKLCWINAMPTLIDEYYYSIGTETLVSWEARYRSGRTSYGKDYYIETIEPDSSLTITIGYIIDDDFINADNLYYSPSEFFTDRVMKDKDLMFYKI